jgi:hypothetical protein
VVKNFEVEEKPEENLLDDTEHETTSGIQNEEDPSEKDENIKNEITEEVCFLEIGTFICDDDFFSLIFQQNGIHCECISTFAHIFWIEKKVAHIWRNSKACFSLSQIENHPLA